MNHSMRDTRAVRHMAAWAMVALIPIGFMSVFFIWPVAALVARGLGATETGGFGDVVGRASFWRVAWFTTWQAAVSTALTLALGLPAARMVARLRFRGRRLVR